MVVVAREAATVATAAWLTLPVCQIPNAGVVFFAKLDWHQLSVNRRNFLQDAAGGFIHFKIALTADCHLFFLRA